MTGNDVITAALLRINAVSPGENPQAAEAAAALATLNDMLDAWQIERLMISTSSAWYSRYRLPSKPTRLGRVATSISLDLRASSAWASSTCRTATSRWNCHCGC